MAEFIKNRRKIIFYRFLYSIFNILGIVNFRKIRNNYLKNLKGKILDIGVGDAGNYRYYKDKVKVTILDFEKNMLEQVRKIIPKNKIANYQFVYGNAQELPFKNNEFDAITVVFIYCCSVPSSIKALKEAKRVLKTDGKLIVLAHVASKNKLIYFFQKRMEPFTKRLIDSDMTRNTENDILKAGFRIIEKKVLGMGDVFNLFVAEK